MYRISLAASWVRQPGELPPDQCIEDIFAGETAGRLKCHPMLRLKTRLPKENHLRRAIAARVAAAVKILGLCQRKLVPLTAHTRATMAARAQEVMGATRYGPGTGAGSENIISSNSRAAKTHTRATPCCTPSHPSTISSVPAIAVTVAAPARRAPAPPPSRGEITPELARRRHRHPILEPVTAAHSPRARSLRSAPCM